MVKPETGAGLAARLFPASELQDLLGEMHQRQLEIEAENLLLRERSTRAALSPDAADLFYDSLRPGYVELNEQGLVERVNGAACGLLEKPRSAILGRPLAQFLAPAERERFRSNLEPSQTGEIGFFQASLLSPPGKTLQFLRAAPQAAGSVRGRRLLLRDVTALTRAKETLARLAAFPALDPNPILEFGPGGTLTWFNDAARSLAQTLGFDRPEKILPAQTVQIVKECLASGECHPRHEAVVGDRHIYWSFFPIPSARVVHGYGTDITERLLVERNLRQAQRLESVGQLAAGIAHDFNNILTIIQGYTSLLLAQRELPLEMSEPLKQVSTASERAANLTRQLMTFSRKQTAQPRTLDLNETLQSLSYVLRRLLGEAIAQQLTLSPSLPPIQADPSMVEQIILNLALNARDAMPGGGKLTLETSAVRIDSDYSARNPDARPGLSVCLTVSDTGKGMHPEILGKIFEPFFTTKESASGLGLSSVYGIVKQHQGWIEVASQAGVGSTFKVFFPAVARAETPPSPEPSAQGGSETILVVEDEPALRELVVRQLRRQGYRILQASSGGEALAIWPEHAQEINLLFTDMVMPDGVTGRDLAETLLAEKPDLKVIYSSGYSFEVVQQDFALRKGAQFLQKPYQTPALIKAIRAALDEEKMPVLEETR